MQKKCIQISIEDNVGVAIVDLKKNEEINCGDVTIKVKEEIKQGHKIALRNIEVGESILKNNFPVGRSTSFIENGMSVHIHNVESIYLNNDHDHYED